MQNTMWKDTRILSAGFSSRYIKVLRKLYEDLSLSWDQIDKMQSIHYAQSS